MKSSILLLLSLAAGSAAAQPTAGQVLDRYLEASGGRAAWEKLETRITHQTRTIDASEQQIEVLHKAPNKKLQVVTTSAGSYNVCFDGKEAWVARDGKTTVLPASALPRIGRESELRWPLRLKSLYRTFAMQGKQSWGRGDAWLIEATPAEGLADKLFFDVETGLLVRYESQRELLQDGKPQTVATQNLYEDYRTVDGVKVPFKVTEAIDDGPLMRTVVSDVKHNVTIDEARFQRPA